MSIEDKELDEMFHGEEKPLHPNTVHITYGKPAAEKKPVKNVPEKDIKEQWQPAKPAPGLMDKLKNAVAWSSLFGGLSCLVFYWNEAGLMASSIAIPTMCVCAALAGFGVGKSMKGNGK